MTAGLRFFYRHIHVTGLENIPPKGPAIIIANHNSSLMDAALLGILLKRKAWFFARGDVFVNKTVQKILWWLHMIPVHSHQEGKKSLGANRDGFSNGRQLLNEGGIIVFFPESYSHIEHQLLPFRKGVFRLAFETATAQNFSFDLPIIPVGISYDHPVACRTEVQVHVGEPLFLSSYKNEYQGNSAAALLHICRDAYEAVSKLVLHITDKARLQIAEQHLVICRNNTDANSRGWKIQSAEKLSQEQEVCHDINHTPASQAKTKKDNAGSYFLLLDKMGLSDKTVKTSAHFPAWKTTLLIIGFPVYLIGLLLNGLPVLLGRTIADKKVYRKDFYSWIFIACTAVTYFLWTLVLVLATLFIGWPYAALLFLAMVFTGLFTYTCRGWVNQISQQKKWKRLSPEKRQELLGMRPVIQQAT